MSGNKNCVARSTRNGATAGGAPELLEDNCRRLVDGCAAVDVNDDRIVTSAQLAVPNKQKTFT